MLDILIKDASVVDGTGSPEFSADIGIKDGGIASVGKTEEKAERTIRAKNLIVSPGFIDIHTHSERITELPGAKNFLRQGVTTVVSGNCGMSPLPVKKHLQEVEAAMPGVNYAVLAGHGAIRKQVMGMDNRPPGLKELRRMQRLMESSMKAGALGISTGLFYVPGAYADISELIELSKSAAATGGVYASHARSAGGKLFEALEEAAGIGRNARIPVEVSHLKVLHKKGRTRKDRADEALSTIERFRNEGIDITFDIHPYPATFTTLSSVVIPPKVSEGGKLAERLADKALRKEIRGEVQNNISWIGGPEKITITDYRDEEGMAGKTLFELSEAAGIDAAELAMDLSASGEARAIFHALRDEDVAKIVLSKNAMIASDGGIRPDGELVHPRYYGTFPRIFREYVRKKKLLSIEEAVRKMTSFPAGKFGIRGRGLLKPGMKADIAVFNPETFADTATFEKPASYPSGLKWVIINGKISWDGEKGSASRHGLVIRNV
jgi:N-acyl-D-amino-acid deacylase